MKEMYILYKNTLNTGVDVDINTSLLDLAIEEDNVPMMVCLLGAGAQLEKTTFIKNLLSLCLIEPSLLSLTQPYNIQSNIIYSVTSLNMAGLLLQSGITLDVNSLEAKSALKKGLEQQDRYKVTTLLSLGVKLDKDMLSGINLRFLRKPTEMKNTVYGGSALYLDTSLPDHDFYQYFLKKEFSGHLQILVANTLLLTLPKVLIDIILGYTDLFKNENPSKIKISHEFLNSFKSVVFSPLLIELKHHFPSNSLQQYPHERGLICVLERILESDVWSISQIMLALERYILNVNEVMISQSGAVFLKIIKEFFQKSKFADKSDKLYINSLEIIAPATPAADLLDEKMSGILFTTVPEQLICLQQLSDKQPWQLLNLYLPLESSLNQLILDYCGGEEYPKKNILKEFELSEKKRDYLQQLKLDLLSPYYIEINNCLDQSLFHSHLILFFKKILENNYLWKPKFIKLAVIKCLINLSFNFSTVPFDSLLYPLIVKFLNFLFTEKEVNFILKKCFNSTLADCTLTLPSRGANIFSEHAPLQINTTVTAVARGLTTGLSL